MSEMESAPTDAAGEQELVAQLDEAEAQSLAEAIAGYHGGFGGESLDLSVSDVEQMAGRRGPREMRSDGLRPRGDAGRGGLRPGRMRDGTCPTRPPGLGNLIVHHWCAYVGVASQRARIVLILMFGAKLGPFLV